MLLCDLDRLKEINDRFGHATGDRVLKAAADVLRERVRAGDLAARLGGDEFGVLCPESDLSAASALAEDLRARCRRCGPPRPTSRRSPSRSGARAGRRPTSRPTELILRADDQLYRAKRRRNAVYPDLLVVAEGDGVTSAG